MGKVEAKIYSQASVQEFLDNYEVGKILGVGGFSVVKRGRDKRTGEEIAIKVVEKARYEQGDNSLLREIEILCKVDHVHCIRLYAVYVTPKKVFIVTELVVGGELLEWVTAQGNFAEPIAANLIAQILDGVAYLHDLGIVHRDLKLENMLIIDSADTVHIKIADFGLSKCFAPNDPLATMCGSPQYVAPEILQMSDGNLEAYGLAVDMWSIGVILFILLSGYSPFDDDVDAVLFEKIRSGEYDADDPIWDSISEQAKDLVAQLLVVDPSQRLSAMEALAHPWIQAGGHLVIDETAAQNLTAAQRQNEQHSVAIEAA